MKLQSGKTFKTPPVPHPETKQDIDPVMSEEEQQQLQHEQDLLLARLEAQTK